MKKKLLATIMAASVMASLTACSSENSESTTTTVATTVASETKAETTTESVEAESEPTDETTAEATETTKETEITIPDLDLATLSTFEVTSADITDGVWNDVITNTSVGENKSPELTWEEVDGAKMYVLYMIDVSAGNWVHMKASNITTNKLEAGELGSDKYVGPYPPSGTHEYVVYVFALRDNPNAVRSVLDQANRSIDKAFSTLDVNEAGESGNIISYGMVSATFTSVG